MRSDSLFIVLVTFTLLLLIYPCAIFAQDNANLETHGFLLSHFSGRTTGIKRNVVQSGDFILAEQRLRLDIEAWAESIDASLRVKTDIIYDAIDRRSNIDIREAYIDYSTGRFDFRLGRQIATWGVGDLIFINDVYPKDWLSFFSGRPMEYLKIGVDAFRARFTTNILNADLLAVPFFTTDNVPSSGRFILPDPFVAVPNQNERLPESSYGNTEFALRLYKNIGGFDLSLYAYRGFWRRPSRELDNVIAPTSVTVFYPSLSVYGLSAQRSAIGGIISFETGYYHSRDDEEGDDPAIPNSEIRFLVGHQRHLWEDATLGFQYYSEVMDDYNEYRDGLSAGLPVQKEVRNMFTLRLEQLLRHQTWRLSLFCFYSPADRDYLVQPYASYKLAEELSLTLGANVFGGRDESTSLAMFDRNDNTFVSIRFDF